MTATAEPATVPATPTRRDCFPGRRPPRLVDHLARLGRCPRLRRAS